MKPIKIIHTADIHLGTEFRNLERKIKASRREESKKVFLHIVNLCRSENVDFLLLAGDIFESWSADEENFVFVRDALSSISETKVVISAGNHDSLTADSCYLKENFWSNNVYIFGAAWSSFAFPELGVEVWGAGFGTPYIENTLLGKASDNGYIKIGVIHGTVGGNSIASSYNPISEAAIEASGLNYLALGHIHKSDKGALRAGNTYYAYSGNPFGRGFDELGARGVLMGEVTAKSTSLKFVEIPQRLYLEQAVDISGETNVVSIAEKINSTLESTIGRDYKEHLYKLILTGTVHESVVLNMESLKSYLSEIYYFKLRDKTKLEIDIEKVSDEFSLKGLFVKGILEQKVSEEVMALALKLGLEAFASEVKYNED